jgi:hypothetical protein
MIKVGFFFADDPRSDWNSSYWRIFLPAKYLHETKKYEVTMAHLTALPASMETFDVYIIERAIFGGVLRIIEKLKEAGKKVFITIDDCYDKIPEYIPSSAVWKSGTKLAELRQGMGIVDGTLVASKELAKYYGSHGKTFLVENYYPDHWFDYPVIRGSYDLGWSGTASHMHSWKGSGCAKAIRGSGKTFLLNCGAFPKMMEILDGLYSKYIPWTKQEDYPQVVDKFNVGLAPLSGEYDNYRSNIKVLLYSVRGKPWAASQLAPYLEAQGGIPTDNVAQNWVKTIEAVYNHYDALSRSAREWAYGYRITANISKYEELFDA